MRWIQWQKNKIKRSYDEEDTSIWTGDIETKILGLLYVHATAVGEDELNFIQRFSAYGALVHPSTFRLIEWSYGFGDDHP